MKYQIQRWAALALSILLAAGTLAGCGAGQNMPQAPESAPLSSAQGGSTAIDTFIIGSTMDIQSISRVDYYYNVLTGTLTHMALVRLDENNQMQPMMADFATEDAKTWTFRIKDGVTWHDGQKVTAEDVKFTMSYLDEKEKTNKCDEFESIQVLDEQTIEFVLKEANVRALSDFTTIRILPRHIFETVEDYAGFQEDAAAMGNGPYKFVRFDPASGVLEFEANPTFVDGAPNIARVIVKLFKNADTMNMALKAGEIDMIYYYAGGVDASAAEDLKNSGNITLSVLKDISNPIVFSMNNQKEPVKRLGVRQAIAAAIDYDKCRELFGSQYSAPSNYGFVPMGTEGYSNTAVLTRDLDAAKKLLAQEGAADSNGDGILELDGKPLELEVLIRSDKPLYARVGELLQANLREVGISVVFKVVDVPTFRAMSETEYSQTSMITRFTAFGMSMGAGMGSAYLDARYAGSGQGQVTDPAFVAIADKMMAAATNEAYLAAAQECQEYYAANVPAIALFWDSYIQAYNSKYDGFTVDGTFGIVNQGTWYSITAK